MNKDDLAFHFVCTRDEAREIVKRFDRYWVDNCGCREERGDKCARSRMDLCLVLKEDIQGSGGSGRKEISRAELDGIFREAEEKHLVARPFRNDKDRTKTEGICFCCDDCCWHFLNPEKHECDRGRLIEKTDQAGCTNCGECVEVCYFKAKRMEDEKLKVNRNMCYGCGLCVDVCPEQCIEMVPRG